MNIFVLNRGSSTIKCSLYRDEKLLWENQGDLDQILQSLPEKPGLIGHRIVHGGKWFSDSVLITSDVKKKIQALSELAPLHNLAEVEGIEILEKYFPKIPQIAVFDTAFHRTLPKSAQVYPIPYHWYEEGIRRYGFHGISYQYCTRRAAELIKTPSKMVICHLGAGASLCAVKDGKSIDTTMGFTPLEGLMMNTRCGSIDPGIILHFLKKRSLEEVSKELYYESGLFGLNGSLDDQASLAFEVYLHRLNSEIGSMVASLQGLDALVFTAGIGENVSLLRQRVCENFSFLGITLGHTSDEKEDTILSSPNSKVQVLLIHTREALEIARECLRIMPS
jgi:acetate kinase